MALSQLDPIWITCVGELALPVLRGGDAYVHFDGHTLRVADDDALDHDDSLAQLVLHEICHALVQGPQHRHTPDWGLDNTGADPFDDVRERAAVRLQAHLLGRHGLRAHLFPTTVVRPFFEALPRDTMTPTSRELDDGSCALAVAAATRAGQLPFRPALQRALVATAQALALPLHRNGAPLADELRCADCAWRAGSGLCHAAERRVFVRPEAIGCVRHEPRLDCLTCGACCRSGYDAVPAGTREQIVKRHPALVVAREGGFDLARITVGGEDRCASLSGPTEGPYACTVYADRPRACSQLPTGEGACLTARRRVGLSPA